jgi:anti-sigma factor RsiW
MRETAAQTEEHCPRPGIAAYLDGDLGSREELELEMHIAVCPTCAAELNEQKKLLCVLDFALEDKASEIELPENFTKVVVANAESKVSGLRCPHERSRAFFVCAGLFLLIFVGLGAESPQAMSPYAAVGEQFLAVGGFFVHLVHDLTIAVSVILRSLCVQFVFKSAVTAAGVGIFFIVSLLLLSRLIGRHNRF